MLVKLIIVLGIYTALAISGYQVHEMLHSHRDELQKENIPKLYCSFYIHILFALFLPLLLKLDNLYHQMLASFFMFLLVFLAIFLCEARSQQEAPETVLINQWDDDDMKKQQTVVDIYYLIYTFSIMGLALTAMFILISEGIAYWQGPPTTRYDGIIDFLDYQEAMRDMQCSICITELGKDGKFWRIKKCGHLFHEDCLKQWLKYNKICPLDRANIL